jgi:dipeptidyl aminopeptidase/acylaminoacyl peptidase
MNQLDRLERDLTVWFSETAAPRTPPYLDDILRQTARIRQRPRWTFLERLLPMTTMTSFRAMTPRVPWRMVGVLALLLVALLLGVLLVGSRQQRLPAPFGRAEPGLVAYSAEGDIFVADPTTKQLRPIVAGPETDRDPQWSRDGTRIVFGRGGLGERFQLFTVRPDGSELTAITPDPIFVSSGDGPSYAFSPDGRLVLFLSGSSIMIAQSDGSGFKEVETPSSMSPAAVAWRPPVGSQVGVVGTSGGLYLVDVADGAVQTLIAPEAGTAAGGIAWSPDGSQLSYFPWSTTTSVFTVRGRIYDFAAGQDRLADPQGADAFWDATATWSNDGQRLAIVRGYTPSGYSDVTLSVIRADGTGPRVETAHGLVLAAECCATFEWAPDDSSILWSPVDATGSRQAQLLIDPDTGAVTPAPWLATSDPAWQRLAP